MQGNDGRDNTVHSEPCSMLKYDMTLRQLQAIRMFHILRVVQHVSSHSSLPLPVTYHACLHDSRYWPWQICVWSLRHWGTLTSLQLFFFFFYKEVLDSVLSVVFLSSQRTQPPATISTTTTQILSPDTTPLMRTSEFSAFSHYLTFPFSYDHYAARA